MRDNPDCEIFIVALSRAMSDNVSKQKSPFFKFNLLIYSALLNYVK